ncbi:MAG: Uma2 family endonuclease [Cyanobacteria bacterium P01_A01_bin.105]
MTQTRPRLKTFADFLAYDDGTDNRYELTNGELIEVPPENFDNVFSATQLQDVLKAIVGLDRVFTGRVAVEMPGQPKNRFPDVVVLQPEHPQQLRATTKAAITLEMRPPLLVVEIVSPGRDNHRRDYVEKRNQYEWCGIPEYWIVDPQRQQVTVLALVNGQYEETVFEGDTRVLSPTFPDWQMTTRQMLSARNA